MSLYHNAMQRIQGLKAGSASAWDQLMKVLQLTPELHHGPPEGQHGWSIDVEDTHPTGTREPDFVLRVRQHNIGTPDQARFCPPNTVANRNPKSSALLVGGYDEHEGEVAAGDARFLRDTYHKRYAMGTVRWGTATAASVAGNPPTVAIQDDEHTCTMTAEVSGVGSNDPGISAGDRVAYVIEYDGTPVTFAGGGGRPKVGTTLEEAREGTAHILVRNNLTGAEHTVWLADTPAGKTPYVNIGSTILYDLYEDGQYWCQSDYTDDPVGTIKGFYNVVGDTVPSRKTTSPPSYISDGVWSHFLDRGKVLPNSGAAPYTHIGATGGNTSHTHALHSPADHALPTECKTVLVDGEFVDCQWVGTTEQICVLAGTCS